MICFLCNKNTFVKKYSLPNAIILMCQACGIYIKETTNQQTEKLYDNNYYDAYPYSNTFGLNKKYFLDKIEKIRKLSAKRYPTILDIGCGWGDFLEVAKGESLPYLGVDHSPAIIGRLIKNHKNNVIAGTIDDIIAKKKKFDAIVSFQTIEHIATPVEFLTKARQLLVPKGIILLTTPNNLTPLRFLTVGKWSVYNIPSHFVFYDKKTLRMLLEKVGFQNISIRIDPPRFFSLGYILSRIYSKPINRLHGEDAHFERLGRCAGTSTPIGAKNVASSNAIFNLPIPTDPLGDLEASAITH